MCWSSLIWFCGNFSSNRKDFPSLSNIFREVKWIVTQTWSESIPINWGERQGRDESGPCNKRFKLHLELCMVPKHQKWLSLPHFIGGVMHQHFSTLNIQIIDSFNCLVPFTCAWNQKCCINGWWTPIQLRLANAARDTRNSCTHRTSVFQ